MYLGLVCQKINYNSVAGYWSAYHSLVFFYYVLFLFLGYCFVIFIIFRCLDITFSFSVWRIKKKWIIKSQSQSRPSSPSPSLSESEF